MKVLIITEDPTHDAFIVQPIVEHLLDEANLRNSRVQVCRDPMLRGASEALDPNVLATIFELHPMVDLFILIVDRDCDRFGHTQKARDRCQEFEGKLLVCPAVEEVEVWMLALHRDSLGVSWSQVREECDPKERFASPLLDRLGRSSPGRGYKGAMRALSGQAKGLLQVCPELSDLLAAIRAWSNQQ